MDAGPEVSFEGLTLHVKDVERSRDFYERIPGAVLQHRRPGQFALFRIGDAWLGLLQLGAPGFHIELVTADLDDLYAELRRNGVEPKGPPRDRSWGERTFLVVDPDGNQIEFQ
jgi:catechol 2,3-dioxygenase-like lactoylglutathione lyase family enzyme